jgi:hypothetical protein
MSLIEEKITLQIAIAYRCINDLPKSNGGLLRHFGTSPTESLEPNATVYEEFPRNPVGAGTPATQQNQRRSTFQAKT